MTLCVFVVSGTCFKDIIAVCSLKLYIKVLIQKNVFNTKIVIGNVVLLSL